METLDNDNDKKLAMIKLMTQNAQPPQNLGRHQQMPMDAHYCCRHDASLLFWKPC